jgi:hypothetical protein
MFCSFLNRNLLRTLTVLSAIIEISLGIDMKCKIRGWTYTDNVVTSNYCYAEGLVITEPNQTITTINGQTETYYHAQKVKSLKFNSQTMNFMPKGLEKLFPQIEQIIIYRSKLKELKKEDLAPFPMLKDLFISRNDLETLPSNLFEANPSLMYVKFNGNKLKFVGENILSPLKKLIWADFERNPCIDKHAASKEEIPAVIAELHNKCKPPQETKPEPQQELLTTTIKDFESIVDSQNKKILDLSSKLDENVKSLEKFNESFDSAETNLTESQLKVEELESKLVESSELREENINLTKQLEECEAISSENQENFEKLQAKLKICETLSKKAEKEIEDLKLAIDEMKVEKKEQKLELNVAKSDVKTERQECKQQLDFFRENQNKLESQWNATLESKLQENAELKQEIEKLKRKNNILLGMQPLNLQP